MSFTSTIISAENWRVGPTPVVEVADSVTTTSDTTTTTDFTTTTTSDTTTTTTSDTAPTDFTTTTTTDFTTTAPTDTSPTDTSPTETAPTETAPTETAPTETAPTETAPTETAPTETAPTETAPTETPEQLPVKNYINMWVRETTHTDLQKNPAFVKAKLFTGAVNGEYYEYNIHNLKNLRPYPDINGWRGEFLCDKKRYTLLMYFSMRNKNKTLLAKSTATSEDELEVLLTQWKY